MTADTVHAAFCWEQPADGRLIACDRKKDHKGGHSWENPLTEMIKGQLTETRTMTLTGPGYPPDREPLYALLERGTITDAQWQHIFGLYCKIMSQHRIAWIRRLAGREVGNVSELSEAEARDVILGLEAAMADEKRPR